MHNAGTGLASGGRAPAESGLRPRDAAAVAGLTLLFLLPLTVLLLPVFRPDRLLAVLAAVFAQGAATTAAIAIVLRRRGFRWSIIGWDTGFRSLMTGVAGGLVVFTLVQVGGWLAARAAGPIPTSPSLQTMLTGHGTAGLLAFIAVAGLLAPASEELFFRGILYTALRNRYGRIVGTLVSATVFALMHGDMSPGILPIWLAGAVLACLYEGSGSLAAPMIAHAIHNTATALVFYLLG